MVIDKQCPFCFNTRMLVKQTKMAVRLVCTFNGPVNKRCVYSVWIPKSQLTKAERLLYGVKRNKRKRLKDLGYDKLLQQPKPLKQKIWGQYVDTIIKPLPEKLIVAPKSFLKDV